MATFPASTATIASGQSLSGAVNLFPGSRPSSLVGIIMPAGWTAADLTFQASNDGTTFTDVYDADGTERTVQADASRWIAFDPADFAGMAYIKVRSGTSASAINQGADRDLILIVRTVA